MYKLDSAPHRRRRHLLSVVAIAFVQIVSVHLLFTALPAAAQVGAPSPTPAAATPATTNAGSPDLSSPAASVLSTFPAAAQRRNGEEFPRPIRAYITTGLLADKPDDMPMAAYCPPDHTIEAAPGEELVFCYRLYNDSDVTFTRHTIVDSIFGVIYENLEYPVPPNFAAQLVNPLVATVTRSNAMTWTVYPDNGDSVSAFDTATVIVPTLEMTATAGAAQSPCSDTAIYPLLTPAEVLFCFRAYNPTPYPLIDHRVIDNRGVELALPTGFTLPPGAAYTVTNTLLVTEPATYSLTWTARTATRQLPITATAAATVRLPSVDLTLSFGKAGAACEKREMVAVPGMPVVYCYTARNTGSATLTAHRVTDDGYDLDYGFPFDLAPDAAVSLIYTQVLTTSTTSHATWYATHTNGIVSATTQSTVVVVPAATVVVHVQFDHAQSGQPVGAASIDIELTAQDGETQSRSTGYDGAARFEDLVPDVYTISVVTSSLASGLRLLSSPVVTANVEAGATITVEYTVTGTLPVRAVHLPIVTR